MTVLLAGRVAEAGELLETALATAACVEPDDHAGVLAHLAAVRRRQARPCEAAALLERARAMALQMETPEIAVGALRELAELDAERGDHRRAYRRLARFVVEQDAYRRVESERQATVLQSIYGAQLERDRRRHYERLATRDALTGLYNRRHVEEHLPGLLAAGAVAVAMADVDHFKQINDRCSHAVADLVLKELGALLERHVAAFAGGFAARLGGEEFLLALPDLTPEAARRSLEQLRLGVQEHAWPDVPATVNPTISVGLVVADANGWTVTGALAAADQRLYAAKRAGRNRVEDGP
jgi:diguanylate cyclase (GGDEF)-like protein